MIECPIDPDKNGRRKIDGQASGAALISFCVGLADLTNLCRTDTN